MPRAAVDELHAIASGEPPPLRLRPRASQRNEQLMQIAVVIGLGGETDPAKDGARSVAIANYADTFGQDARLPRILEGALPARIPAFLRHRMDAGSHALHIGNRTLL